MNTLGRRTQVVNVKGQRVGTGTHLAVRPGLDIVPVAIRAQDLGMVGPRKQLSRVTGCAVLVGALLAPTTAGAASAPAITDGPTVAGEPRVAVELRAQATWTGDPAPTAAWTWLRCARPNGNCATISDAAGDRYRVRAEDLGMVLRVRLRVSNGSGADEKRSGPTGVVLPALPPSPSPSPSPTPTADPAPTATPTVTPTPVPEVPVVFDSAAPAPSPVTILAPVLEPTTPAAPRRLRPFPVVRIKGMLTTDGAIVTLLRVRAPRGVTIAVSCRGRGCPRKAFTAPSGARRLRLFERALPAGTRLELRITKRGFIGKYTSFVIRRGAAPARRDRCLRPGSPKPELCAPR
jgi:hypothetical protein